MTNNTDDSALVEIARAVGAELRPEQVAYLTWQPSESIPSCDREERISAEAFKAGYLAALRTRESDAAKIEAWLRAQAREWSDAGEGLVAAAISGLADAIPRGDWRDTPSDTERDALVEEPGYARRLRYAVEAPTGKLWLQRLAHLTRHDVREILTALKAQEKGS